MARVPFDSLRSVCYAAEPAMSEPMPHDAVTRAVRAAFGLDACIVATEPLFGDASSRRYLRLRLAGAGERATAVLMLLEDVGDVTLWAAASRDPARVPALFGAAVDLLVALQVAGARHPDATCY